MVRMLHATRATRWGLALCTVLFGSLIAGCSGGGGGNAAPTTTAPIDVANSPTASPHPSLTPVLPSPTASDPVPPTPTATATTLVAPTATASSAPTNTATEQPPTATPPAPTPTVRPTLSPTPTPLTGPIVTTFALASADGTFKPTVDTDGEGRPVYSNDSNDDFILFVEGRPGPSRLPVGTQRFSFVPGDPSGQPDLQIESTQSLGNGSAAVCDDSFPTLGGVPGINPSDFSAVQPVSDALNDFSCRFRTFAETDFACTQDGSGNYVFANSSSTVQFCVLIDNALVFPATTVLTVRLRDTAGHAGPPAQIVVHIAQGS